MKGGTAWLHTLLTPLSTSDLPDFRKSLGGQIAILFIDDSLNSLNL